MEQLVHGGDWAGYRAQFGRDALDFSANVSPLGLPEGVAKAITAALPTADRYPDPLCRELRAKLALHEGVPADHILCGNGAADLIFRLVWARKPRRALVTAPTFAEYAAALETIGCTVERFILQAADDFAVPEAFLSAIDDRVDLVFLCQPNNPTGQLTPPDFVARILQRCTACGALLVLDECFLDFLPDHAQLTAKPLLGSGDLLILKAFTKLYALREKVHQLNSPDLNYVWRFMQSSDHFYYMATKWFSDGDVHSYFNPYGSPYEAFVNYMNVLSDFEIQIQRRLEAYQNKQAVPA